MNILEEFWYGNGVCEPGRVLCLVSYWNCHVIFEDEGRKELNPCETQWEFAHINMLDGRSLLRCSGRTEGRVPEETAG